MWPPSRAVRDAGVPRSRRRCSSGDV